MPDDSEDPDAPGTVLDDGQDIDRRVIEETGFAGEADNQPDELVAETIGPAPPARTTSLQRTGRSDKPA